MSPHLPWWVWTAPLWPTLLTMIFVLLAGWLQGCRTGQYPALREFVQALRTLSPLTTSDRLSPDSIRPAAVNGPQTDQPPRNGTGSPDEHPADAQTDPSATLKE